MGLFKYCFAFMAYVLLKGVFVLPSFIFMIITAVFVSMLTMRSIEEIGPWIEHKTFIGTMFNKPNDLVERYFGFINY